MRKREGPECYPLSSNRDYRRVRQRPFQFPPLVRHRVCLRELAVRNGQDPWVCYSGKPGRARGALG